MDKFKSKHKLLVGGLMFAAAMAIAPVASATIATVDNIMFPLGHGSFAGSMYETPVSQVGDTLSGYGAVTTINDLNSGPPASIGNFCASGSCSLTYQFGGYQVQSLSATEVVFSGGWVNFYANGQSSPNPAGLDYTGAGQGDPWLTLVGQPWLATLTDGTVTSVTLYGTGQNIGTGSDKGSGTGDLSVTYSPLGGASSAGLANSFFDTNTYATGLGIFADALLGSTFTGYPTSEAAYSITGSSTMSYYAVPEPNDLGIMGLGLLMVGLLGLRFRQSRYRH